MLCNSNIIYLDFGEHYSHIYIYYNQGIMYVNTTYDVNSFGELLTPVFGDQIEQTF